MQASVKHQVDLVKLRCENNKLQTALQKAADDKECTHVQVVYYFIIIIIIFIFIKENIIVIHRQRKLLGWAGCGPPTFLPL